MKSLSCLLFAIVFFNVGFASDIPCNVIGTSKDPNIIKLLESKPGSSTPEESLLSYKDQYADAVRCKHKQDAFFLKNNIELLESAIARDREKRENSKTSVTERNSIEVINPKAESSSIVVKKISIECEDEATKPKTRFKILGTDTNGAVVAEGYKDQMLVRLIFDNHKPELGRTIEVVVNGESNTLSLNPGLGPIGFKSGFVMRMLLKTMGVNSDIKINCSPLSQTVISEPALEVIPTKNVDDSGRDKKKASEDMEPINKSGSDTSSAVSRYN